MGRSDPGAGKDQRFLVFIRGVIGRWGWRPPPPAYAGRNAALGSGWSVGPCGARGQLGDDPAPASMELVAAAGDQRPSRCPSPLTDVTADRRRQQSQQWIAGRHARGATAATDTDHGATHGAVDKLFDLGFQQRVADLDGCRLDFSEQFFVRWPRELQSQVLAASRCRLPLTDDYILVPTNERFREMCTTKQGAVAQLGGGRGLLLSSGSSTLNNGNNGPTTS